MTSDEQVGFDSRQPADIADSLWNDLEELRNGTNLQWSEFSEPVLGIVFLRSVSLQFDRTSAALGDGSARRPIGPGDYHEKGVLFVPAEAHFDYLLNTPEGASLAGALNDAMKLLEKQNPDLRGLLPKTYGKVLDRTLNEAMRLLSPIEKSAPEFGAVFSDLLARVAAEEGQEGGDHFVTAGHIVDLMVAVVNPVEGRVLDPCSGSGGMFVGCTRRQPDSSLERGRLHFYGQEKSRRNAALSVMNLAVHGADALIEVVDSYKADPHESAGKFDYAFANPKFNDDAFDASLVKGDVRYPFGVPSASKANYLWLQMCYSALNEHGRASVVMPNTASDGSKKDATVRRRMLEVDAIEAVVAVGAKMFGSITNSATLWFFNRSKADHQRGQVLFIDARGVYTQVDAAHRVWSAEQVEYLARIIGLWRCLGQPADGPAGTSNDQLKMSPYVDVLGLCRAVTVAEIEHQGWSLSPGRYVGTDIELPDDGEFSERRDQLRAEFDSLSEQASRLLELVSDSLSLEVKR